MKNIMMKNVSVRGFRFPNYKKSFLLGKYKKFLNIRARKFHFPKYKEFFLGGGGVGAGRVDLGLKSALDSSIIHYF